MGFFDSRSTTVTNTSNETVNTSIQDAFNVSSVRGDTVRNTQISIGGGTDFFETPFNAGVTNAATAPFLAVTNLVKNPMVIIVIGVIAFMVLRKK